MNPLQSQDPELYNLIDEEITRQKQNLNLIASENYCSKAVYECLATPTQNKYSEGFPGKRFYGGTQVIDKLENLARERALELFKLNPEEWDVTVQCYSGCVANMVAYSAVLDPGDVVLGMHRKDGGHISHGLRYGNQILSHSAKFFNWEHYGVDMEGWMDYDYMDQVFLMFH
jgi:glycine hydroxymethyltransferase